MYIFFFAYILKRCRNIFWRTSVGGNLRRTSVGGNIGMISSKLLKLWHILHQKDQFFHIFLKKMSEGPRKDVGRWKSQKDIGRRNSRKYVCNFSILGTSKVRMNLGVMALKGLSTLYNCAKLFCKCFCNFEDICNFSFHIWSNFR